MRLDDNNWLIYAAKFYDNPSCFSDEEFIDDIQRIKYIKRLFKRYKDKGELKERLILNHIIILNNVFGPEATTKLLFLHLGDEYKEYLKPFLCFLGLMPEKVIVRDDVYLRQEIIDDESIIKKLEVLK